MKRGNMKRAMNYATLDFGSLGEQRCVRCSLGAVLFLVQGMYILAAQ